MGIYTGLRNFSGMVAGHYTVWQSGRGSIGRIGAEYFWEPKTPEYIPDKGYVQICTIARAENRKGPHFLISHYFLLEYFHVIGLYPIF